MAGRLLTMDKQGFTIIEMTVVVFLLTTAILGIGASSTYMLQAAATAGLKAEALQAVEGRISQIVMDPRYADLEALYEETESDLPGLEGVDRVTRINHVEAVGQSGHITDYKVVTVSVSGPNLGEGISRTMTVGSP